MKEPLVDNHLLKKYLDGECTDQEIEIVEKWYEDLTKVSNYLDNIPVHDQERLKSETYAFIRKTLNQRQSEHDILPIYKWVAGIAASLLVVSILYFTQNKKLPVSQHKLTEQPTADSEFVTFVNEQTKIAHHKLPDGTIVWMHEKASITYPKQFGSVDRRVTFSGEGYFEVAHDKAHPFLIQAGKMGVKVLGTSFNVKASATDHIYEVSVVTGKVSVSATGKENGDKVVLKEHDRALFETESERLTIAKQNTHQTRKEIYEPVSIVFDATSLEKVAEKLEQRFNIEIHISNPKMNTCGITADFEEQSLPAILDMLCTSLDANYKISGQTILLNGPACD